MKHDSDEIIRYWKDTEFREASGAACEANPAGTPELDDALLEDVSGSFSTEPLRTFGCCPGISWYWGCPFDTNAYRTYGCCNVDNA